MQFQQGYAPVTIDTRALIDKVLARYSGEFSVFRELLQNSDDAGCDAAEIHFETAAFLGRSPEATMDSGQHVLSDLETTDVAQWTFKNHGQPFAERDWHRLPRIALGNPDPRKVGAFGVGFYSLFSVTEKPYVSSGDKEMEFSWDEDDQLYYRFGDRPGTAIRDLWTTFKMPLREPALTPPVSDLMQFLATSITFMAHLRDVAVFFDRHLVGRINKSLGQSRDIPIPEELERRSPGQNMMVNSVRQHPITIEAGIMLQRHDPVRIHKMKMDLMAFTAEVDVTVDKKLSQEINRCTKKNPPSRLKYSLIYTRKDEYDQSRINEQQHSSKFPFVFRGLTADLDGATHTRVFIGHATAQTTGVGGHMASHFFPTVERESMDLAHRNIAIWNEELLYVGGLLCRVVYESEVSNIQSSWEEEPPSCPSGKLQDQRFIHLLKFFTFHCSTPSPKVAEILAKSFYGCSNLPLKFLSCVGVRSAPEVRAFDRVVAKFVKSVPMLSEDVMEHCVRFVATLPDHPKVCEITALDVCEDLRHSTLDVEELVACLRWWITSRQKSLTSNATNPLAAATFRGPGRLIHLSSIKHFIDPELLGVHVPPDGPLPPSVLPLAISARFNRAELASFGWEEFTIVSWLRHITCRDVMLADENYDLSRSVNWASLVLRTLRCVWSQLSKHVQNDLRKVLRDKPCIPTSQGLHRPECSYLPIPENPLLRHLELPVVSHHPEFEVDKDMAIFLVYIGVCENPPVQPVLDQMLSTGDWAVSNLLDYLVQRMSSLTSDDISALTVSEIFIEETSRNIETKNTCRRAAELYPPTDIFRRLRLPVIEWSGNPEWDDTSTTAQLLYRLGLNHFPPLPKIVELCSSEDDKVQEIAFEYLCDNLRSQYLHYQPEEFRDKDFIPAESGGRTCLKKLGEVYSDTQWKVLGFSVVQDQYLIAPLHQLGVMQHPPTSKVLDLLEQNSPPNEEIAVPWFEALFDHLACFSPSDLIKLSRLPIVPTTPLGTPRWLPPSKCYLDPGIKPSLYAKLFVFVDFGIKANRFLSACGLKTEVSVEDIAEALIENPERFLQLAGGYDSFLVELRKLAYQNQAISNPTLHKMSRERTLLGVRRKKTEGPIGWDYEHLFRTYREVIIVDDVSDYELFSDCLFVVPREEVLERFYALLGCRYLSGVVRERYNDFYEIQDTETCDKLRSLILDRLPLFIQNYTDGKPRFTIPSSPNRLKVKSCESILVSKTLELGNVERKTEVRAIARREGECIELWIAKLDMYEIATSLCRLLFGTNKMNATLLLGTILSADLNFLERRGILVDQFSRQHKDGSGMESKTRQNRSGVSSLTANSLQQSTPDPQLDSQSNCERLPGGSAAGPQFPSFPQPANSVLLKIPEASNVPSDNSLDTIRTSRQVISPNYIRYNVKKAIEACTSWGGGRKSAIHTDTSQFLRSGFCKVSADRAQCLRHIGNVKNVQVCLNENTHIAMPTFMEAKCGPLARFVDILISLSKIYAIPTETLRIFYDILGGCIAFNCRGVIYLNLRYFEVWHDDQVKSGNRQNAQMAWFLALAHEVAHNLTELHDSEHEFWFSAICEAHLPAFSRLLRPPTKTWLHFVGRRQS